MTDKPAMVVDASDADSPEETLFKCALAVSERYDMCIICLVESLHKGTMHMVRERILTHGMDPRIMSHEHKTLQ